MKHRRLAVIAACLLPASGFCQESSLHWHPKDAFARAAWQPSFSSFQLGGSRVSLGVAAGPNAGLRGLTGGEVQLMFPMLSMGLGHGAQLALIPRSGRGGSGAMLAVQLKPF
jgi:hypothetical protein